MRFILLLFLASCTLAPRYERPELVLSSDWREKIAEHSTIESRWWEQFGDPVLNELVDEALACNQELKMAVARIDQFRARLGEVASKLFPQLSAEGIATRQKVSASVTALPDNASYFNVFGFMFNASYIADIWGIVRSAVHEADFEYLASIQAQEIVWQSLVIAVIDSYVQLLQADRQLQISWETLHDRQVALEKARLRFELGYTSKLPVEQAITQVEQAEVEVERFDLVILETENLLCLLLGKPSEKIERGGTLEQLCLPASIPDYSPTELICQRPDIREAELKLMAANANIGVARARFLPQVNPFASWGSETATWRSLFTTPAEIWSYGTTIIQEIFTGGRLTSGLQLSFAKKEEMVHSYLQTVLNAVREVNNAFVAHKIALEVENTQRVRVKALKEYLRLAFLRYEEGETDYLTYLDAERHLFSGLLDLEKAKGNSFFTYAQLYEALGGAWIQER